MESQDDDKMRAKSDPIVDNTTSNDPWSKYKKVRKMGRIERRPPSFIHEKNTQTVMVTDQLAGNQWKNQIGKSLTSVTSDSEIYSSDASVDNTMPCRDHSCDSVVSSHSNGTCNEYVSNGGAREKKNSINVSIHEEIRRSFSRTRSLSVSMIKNIFKKSKTFHNSSDTLISARPTSAADAIIPNFIFKYHTEDVDDPLPQSAKVGWFRQCCAAFAS